MKKILLLIFLWNSFLVADKYNSEYNEYMSDVYFANGIDTPRKIADESKRKLSKKFKAYNSKASNLVLNWQVSYNHTHGIGIDLYESMLQKIYEDSPGSSLSPFLYNLDEVVGLLKWDFKTLVGKVARKTESIPTIKGYASILAKKLGKKVFETYNKYGKKFTQEQIELMFKYVFDDLIDNAVNSYIDKTHEEVVTEELADVHTQKKAYTQSIIDGHGVIIVAHSQGNLFTNRAYNDLGVSNNPNNDAWMKQYISAIGIASPANNILGKNSPYMTFDNDMIWLVPDHLSTNITNPKRYYFTNALGEEIETIVSVEAHSFLTSYMATDITGNAILGYIEQEVKGHKDKPSQWQPKNLGCLCKNKYAKMTHIYDPNGMNQYLANEKVKDFAEGTAGKIYRADAGDHSEYVRALDGDRSKDGVFTIEPLEEEGACYVLKDDTSTMLGKIEVESEETIPKSGIITVELRWKNIDIDMNLEVDMPFGEQDIKDVGCPQEHYYVASEQDVEPGVYPVYVRTDTSDIDASVIPQRVSLVIHASGEAMTFDFNITSVDMLNIGHVANIIIKENKLVQFESFRTGTGFVEVKHYVENPVDGQHRYTEFLYEIQSTLKQAMMGPLSNAVIKVTEAKSFHTNVDLYVGATSGGESILTSGLLHFPNDFLRTLDDKKYYVISIVGGTDIDANDDGIVDDNFRTSRGTLHAILSGRRLKNENFKVTILTEVAYQLTKDMFIDDLNTTKMIKKIDYISRKLLNSDIDFDGKIDHNDLLCWIPTNDKESLRKNYDTAYSPIAEKIYKNETIYNESVALINVPQLMMVNENVQQGTLVGQLVTDLEEPVSIHSLSGQYSDSFIMNSNGKLILADEQLLDFETVSHYKLNAIISDGYENDFIQTINIAIINIIESPPKLELSTFGAIAEDFLIGEVVMQIGTGGLTLDENSVDSYKMVNASVENMFQIDADGVITLISPLDFETQSVYWVDVVAINVAGESEPVRYMIHVTNVSDGEPVLNDTTFNISEHAEIETTVGNVDINSSGVFPIVSMSITGMGAEAFDIDKNGTVVLRKILDYASQNIYELNVSATSQFGTSDRVTLIIEVENILEVPPVLQDINITLKSNITVDSVLGNVLKEIGDTPIDEFVISGTDMFSVDTNGDIYLKKPLYENNQTQYTFTVYAKTMLSQSNSAMIHIKVVSSIINSIDTPNRAMGVVLSSDGTKAYVADGYAGLQVIDVSNIMEVQIIGSLDTPYYAMSVVLSSDGLTAFIADGDSGIQIVDISIPISPQVISSIDTLGFASDIVLSADENKIYVADGYSGIQIIDIAEGKIIQTIDTSEYASHITLSADGMKVYVEEGNRLQIVDISNVSSARITGVTYTPNYFYNVLLSKDKKQAYHASGSVGLEIVDSSDITAPQTLEIIDTRDWAQAVTLSKDGTKVFVADDSSGLQIIDIRQKEIEDKVPGLYSPPIIIDEDASVGSIVGQMQITYQGRSGITSMVLQGEGSEDFAIDMNTSIRLVNPLDYDVKNTYELKVLAMNSVGTREIDVMIRVHTVPEISDFSTTVNSMSEAGTLVGRLDMWADDETTIDSILLSGVGSESFTINNKGQIYVAPNRTLHHFITEEYNLSVVATNRYGSAESKIHIKVSAIALSITSLIKMKNVIFSSDGTKVYVLGDEIGLKIIDISDMKSPRTIQTIDLPDNVMSMVLSKDENKVFVANGSSGLQVVDISDVNNITIIGSISNLTYAYDIALSSDETKTYIADMTSGIRVIDISEPSLPKLITTILLEGNAEKVVLSGDSTKIFVGNNDYPEYKLQIIDITDSIEPMQIASLDTSGEISSMVVSPNGTELFVANWSLGLQIIDISNLASPAIINTIETNGTNGTFHQVAVSSDGKKVMALDNRALQIIDIYDSLNPLYVGTVDDMYYSASNIDISIDGTKVIVADWRNGVYVIDLIGLDLDSY